MKVTGLLIASLTTIAVAHVTPQNAHIVDAQSDDLNVGGNIKAGSAHLAQAGVDAARAFGHVTAATAEEGTKTAKGTGNYVVGAARGTGNIIGQAAMSGAAGLVGIAQLPFTAASGVLGYGKQRLDDGSEYFEARRAGGRAQRQHGANLLNEQGQAIKEAGQDAYEATADVAHHAGDKINAGYENVRESVREKKEAAAERAQAAKEETERVAEDARIRAEETAETTGDALKSKWNWFGGKKDQIVADGAEATREAAQRTADKAAEQRDHRQHTADAKLQRSEELEPHTVVKGGVSAMSAVSCLASAALAAALLF